MCLPRKIFHSHPLRGIRFSHLFTTERPGSEMASKVLQLMNNNFYRGLIRVILFAPIAIWRRFRRVRGRETPREETKGDAGDTGEEEARVHLAIQ